MAPMPDLNHRGVYAVGHRRLTRNSRLWAAVLAAGDDAVLSHRSAAGLHGLRADNSMRIDVTVPRRPRPRGGITLHTVRGLDSRDRDVCDGLPVATVVRPLLDLAEVVLANQLRRAFDEA